MISIRKKYESMEIYIEFNVEGWIPMGIGRSRTWNWSWNWIPRIVGRCFPSFIVKVSRGFRRFPQKLVKKNELISLLRFVLISSPILKTYYCQLLAILLGLSRNFQMFTSWGSWPELVLRFHGCAQSISWSVFENHFGIFLFTQISGRED